ncbi:MAG: EAL domain-containing protein [Spirochaetaceae bacterium]|nr:EAL domain-containing protein [Spirochaetaceae bacterium]
MRNRKLKWQNFFSIFDNEYVLAVVLFLFVFLCLISMAFVFTYKNVRHSSTATMIEELQLYTDEIGTALHEAELQLTQLAAEPKLVEFITSGQDSNTPELIEKIKWETDVIQDALPVIDSIGYFDVGGAPLLFDGVIGNAALLKNIISWMFLNTMPDRKPLFLTLPDNASNISYFIVPIMNDEEPCGFIVSKTSRVYFYNYLDRQTFGRSGTLYILDNYLNMLCGALSPAEWSNVLVQNPGLVEKILPKVNESAKEVVFRIADQPERIAVTTINREFNIVLCASVNRLELAVNAFASLRLLLITSMFMFAAAVCVNILLYKRLDTPLEKMVARCMEIKTGKQDVRFEKFRDKNLNILAETLNETISSMSAYQANLEVMAFTDPLLGIGNRSALIRALEEFIRTSRKDFSIFMIDVVDFDHFNELFSVKTGDMLLRKTAAMLDTVSQSNVYRYNGDTFVIITPNADGAKCANVIREIKEYFANPVDIPAGRYTISMNAGRADYPDHGTTPLELLRSCKTALKYSKTLTERNLCIVYSSIINDAVGRGNVIKDIVLDAIQRNQTDIEVVYQPVYSIGDGKFTRLEALLRIKNSQYVISPEEAVAVAESNGFINDLGDIIIRNVCEFAKTMLNRKTYIDTISINLSVVQLLQHGFFDRVKKILTDSQIPLSFFEFEITESVLINSFESVKEKIAQIKSLGIRIALDDFGAGYSGINYLANLPVDTLKLDRQIVYQLGRSKRQDVLVKSIIDACKSFNLSIVTEGVETKEVLNRAIELGADYIQGFFYAMPMSGARLLSFLEEARLVANFQQID